MAATATSTAAQHLTTKPKRTLRDLIYAPKPWHLLSGTALKWIALICMAIDHTAAILILEHYYDVRYSVGGDAALWYDAYIWMRRIGRVTFPIFCFVLVEGFVHTRSKPKYALRMLAFAIISEVPYDFALHNGAISYTEHLNVIFTLLLAFCALWLADELGKLAARALARIRGHASETPRPIWWVTALLSIAAIAGAAWLADGPIDVSYHAYGIILIGVLYLARNHRLIQFGLGCAATYWYCLEHGSMLQMWAVAGLACIMLYNGKRGRGMKYLFYVFYPAHLLVLGLLKMWLF